MTRNFGSPYSDSNSTTNYNLYLICYVNHFAIKEPVTFCNRLFSYFPLSSQKATALAAATFREATPWYMGIFTV